MPPVPDDLLQHLRRFDQDHVFAGWDTLTVASQADLVHALQGIDFVELQRLYARRDEQAALPAAERVTPLPRPRLDAAHLAAYTARAIEAFRAGQVAFLVVAGGQGSRLGFDAPKGLFPLGPVSNRSLFQIHAEKVLALSRRHGRPLPLLVMTSPTTDAATRQFFAREGNFGLAAEDVRFFCQGTMPALDLATGKLLLDAPGQLALTPDGHGGTITALARSGLLAELPRRGVSVLYYFQVDNPLVDLADAIFIGQHLSERAEVSSKVVAKRDPMEKVGNFVLVDDRCTILEYSDLPASWAQETDRAGQPRLWAGSPAIHLFDVAFLRTVTDEADGIPWHVARKKVPSLNDRGQRITPAAENALKFERFVFDVLPRAERWAILETTREAEFAPVKNADGLDSPATARQAMCNQAADWLARVGVPVCRDPHGNAAVPVEISPLFALDPDELAAKARGLPAIDRPTYFHE